MTNPTLAPALAPALAPLPGVQAPTSQTVTQGKIITVPGVPGHFIQVQNS